jgi:hypothetical protein
MREEHLDRREVAKMRRHVQCGIPVRVAAVDVGACVQERLDRRRVAVPGYQSAKKTHGYLEAPDAGCGVVPLAAFTSAPAATSIRTSAACPPSAARLSAVHRSRALRAFTSARASPWHNGVR